MSNGENQEVNIADLERMTNEAEGWTLQTDDSEQTTSDVAPQTEGQVESTPESQTVAPEAPKQEVGKSVGIPDDVLKVLEETPFKSVPDVVKAYKNSQSEYTKLHEKVKPFEQLLNDASTDVQFRQFIEQATQLYRNPSLAQAYQQPQQTQTAGINPANYDLYTPEGQAAYQQAVMEHAQKAAFETVNQRMAGWEQQQQLERAKLEFRQKFPDVNPDDVIKFAQERANRPTPLEDIYKVMSYDQMKAKAYEEARKEVLAKAGEATKNSPVSSQASEKVSANPIDVMKYVQKNGLESANKKWGANEVTKALKQFTEEFS